ncbi:MAG TPA: hypothetical protein VMV69_03140 [Pirellulales bacterium]|nr:hypothetical protein [Pirellulales bacterium]
MPTTFRPLLVSLVILAAPSAGSAERSKRQLPPATLSAIQNSVTRLHDQVQSLEVQYCMSEISSDPKEQVHWHRHRFAVKGRLRFRDNVHFDARFPAATDLNHTQQYFTVEAFDYFVQHSRVYEISHDAATQHYPWKVRADTFIDSCGWWPVDDDPSTDETAAVAVHLRFVLVHPKYVLREKSEYVDGHPCYVVENRGIDRLWLDPARGFALRKRERYDPISGSTLYRQRMSGFKSVATSGELEHGLIWFPMFASLQSLKVGEQANSEMRVETLKLNQVDEGVFRFVPPAGTLVLDRDSGKCRQVPGGRDLLDDSVALAQNLRVINTGERYTVAVKAFSLESAGLTAVLVFLITVNVLLFVRACR